MTNLVITNVDTGNVILESGDFEDGALVFAGAGTVLEGTILARDSVSFKFVPYVIGGVVNENGIPKAVISYDVVAEGAGDIQTRPMVSGRVREERLIVDADGDGSNITPAILDQLRDYKITAVSVDDLSQLDNQ